MAYEKHNYQSGAVLMASELNEMDNAIEALDQETTQLKDDLNYKTTNVYGGNVTNTYITAISGKTWHSTLGILVNNAKRAASDKITFTPDIKKLDVASSYKMIVYGNNEGVGNVLSQVSSSGVVTFAMDDFPYKYIYIVVFEQNQTELTTDLTDVLSITKYDSAMPFALEQDLENVYEKIGNIYDNMFIAEKETGYINLNLYTNNLINSSVSGQTGLAVDDGNTTRVCTKNLITIVPNVPIYYTRPITGYFNPLIYYFKNGVYQGYDSHFISGNSYDADAIRFLFLKNPTSDSITPQNVVDSFKIWQESQTSYNKRISTLEDASAHTSTSVNDYSLIAYGDSLTTGAGATDSNHTYWGVCATQLAMKSRIGFGFGGSQSKAIAWTAGGISGYVPPNVRTFNIKYADLESNVTIAANALNGKTVIVNGIEYTISQTGTTTYSLPDTYNPSNIYLPIVNKNSKYTADIYVIWMGTNDNGMQWDLIDAIIAKLPHKKYVIMGLTRLGTDTSIEDEQKGYQQYGSHFLNTRVQIIKNAFQILGETPTAEDTAAMSNGLMPPSLLVDGLHFNNSGYEVIGKILAKHIMSLGYDFQTN